MIKSINKEFKKVTSFSIHTQKFKIIFQLLYEEGKPKCRTFHVYLEKHKNSWAFINLI